MRNPFLSSAGPKFVDREEILLVARETARQIGAAHPQVLRVLLFGSFARGDYGTRSDLDLLVILKESAKPAHDRIADFLQHASAYPTDVFPLTEAEIESRLEEGDPFLRRAMSEGILLYSRS
jgi:predicted nucleotidyltransferase